MNKRLNNLKLKLVVSPSPSLRKPTKKVTDFKSKELLEQIEQMFLMMHEEGGVGFAANQIGYDNRVIVAELEDEEGKENIPPTVFINPEIVESSNDTDYKEEGCLSVPLVKLDVDRSLNLKVKYQDLHGRTIKFAPKGILARILQHEIDHLDGILFTDRVREKIHLENPDLKKVKIAFFGTGDYAAVVLQGLFLMNLDVAVYTEKSKVHRNKEIISPVAKISQIYNKKYLEIENLDSLKLENIDLIISADFGKLIPEKILKMAKIDAVNIHPSLLPKYQGATPIPAALLAGDNQTGVSIIKMVPVFDAGPIYATGKVEIYDNDDAVTLEERLAAAGLKLLLMALPKIIKGQLEPIEQDLSQASYTKKIKKQQGEIDWNKPISQIERQIRAYYPWPGSYTLIDGKRFIIHEAHLCDGKLALDIVQLEGKPPMLFKDFLNGFKGKKPKWFNKII